MKTIHPAVAQHAMEENEKLRGLLGEVRVLLANSSYKISGTAAFLHSIDAALSQQAEPTDTFTAVDMATAAAQGLRDGQAAVEPAPAQGELLPCPFCGGEARLDQRTTQSLWNSSDAVFSHVACDECDISGQDFCDDPNGEEASEWWNRRAQPAEAEGVDVVGFLYKNNGEALTAAGMDADTFALMARSDFDGAIEKLVRQRDHLAALSAATAERDGLAAARMAYANEFEPDENGDPDVGNVHANIRALKAERDRLLSDNASLRGSCKALGEENKQLKRENKRQGRTIAAMAAEDRP